MRITSAAVAAALMVFAGLQTAAAKPVEKATSIPLAVKLDWQTFGQRVNGVHLDCGIYDADGQRVGRGSMSGRIDPAFLSARGTVDTVMPAVIAEGADPEAGLNCVCQARFDTRSIFFRSGNDDFGQRPLMFYRPMHRAKAICAPAEAASGTEEHS